MNTVPGLNSGQNTNGWVYFLSYNVPVHLVVNMYPGVSQLVVRLHIVRGSVVWFLGGPQYKPNMYIYTVCHPKQILLLL